MEKLMEEYGFHLLLILVGMCWAMMGIYVYERIKEQKK
jgi:hypothetical protein